MNGMGQSLYEREFEKGERRFAKLVSLLFEEGKIDEIKLVVDDVDARHKKYIEYNIPEEVD